MYIIAEKGYSYSDIGRYFNRDHASVINACKTVSNLLQVDEKWRNRLSNALKLF